MAQSHVLQQDFYIFLTLVVIHRILNLLGNISKWRTPRGEISIKNNLFIYTFVGMRQEVAD